MVDEALLLNLRRYRTVGELHRSAFFAEAGPGILELLGTPRHFFSPQARPRLRSFLRIASWNIEKGKRLPRIVETFRSDPALRWADAILLNEVDLGMARSGNLDVARTLACELGMHMTFAPAHLELTKGTDDDLDAPGNNRESLQGNAILSRYPLREARVVPLPVCFEPFEFHEKRYGTRNCLWARLDLGPKAIWLGAVHFEVRKTPACRASQMRHVLAHLPGGRDEQHVLAGDFNTGGFARGTRWRTLRSVALLLARSPAAMQERMCHPERGPEPLFGLARAAGFVWDGLNTFDPTACTPVGSLEDSSLLPGPLARFTQRRLAAYQGYLRFKLDWILGRGVSPAHAGEVRDAGSGEVSLGAGSRDIDIAGAGRVSDHLPIFADIKL